MKKYYLYSHKRSFPGTALFWKQNQHGYEKNHEMAGVFDENFVRRKNFPIWEKGLKLDLYEPSYHTTIAVECGALDDFYQSLGITKPQFYYLLDPRIGLKATDEGTYGCTLDEIDPDWERYILLIDDALTCCRCANNGAYGDNCLVSDGNKLLWEWFATEKWTPGKITPVIR